jgi:signal transduction histidine kinase/CheY-like chemotaxis protein
MAEILGTAKGGQLASFYVKRAENANILCLAAATPILSGNEVIAVLLIAKDVVLQQPFTSTLLVTEGRVQSAASESSFLLPFVAGMAQPEDSGAIFLPGSAIAVSKISIPGLTDPDSYLLAGIDEHATFDQQKMIIFYGSLLGVGILLCLTAYAMYLSRRLTRPLLHMVDAAENIALGHFRNPLEISSNDEIGQLSHSFNLMMDSLAQAEHAFKRINDGLEDMVSARTADLSLALTELEKAKQASEDSKIEAGQLQFDYRSFKLDQLLENIISTMDFHAVEKGLQIQTFKAPGLPEAIIGDDLRLQQILLNLVSNAIKFTTRGSITIKVQPAAERIVEGKISLHFSVTDTGIGIAPDKQAEIFRGFQQADSSYTRQYGGTGLGLTISKQLTELMGGIMWVESQLNVGSTFHFFLDFVPGPEEMVDPAQVETNRSGALAQVLSILVVDDNEVNREVAKMLLEKDHTVTVAADGLDALQKIGRESFGLVLMDVQMPSMDGLITTTVIRCLEKGWSTLQVLPDDLAISLGRKLFGGHLPIIAMTAHAMGGDRELCLASGMDGYITKPFQPLQLAEMCRSLLDNPGLGRSKDKACESAQEAPMVMDSDEPVTLAQVAGHLCTTTNLTIEQGERVLAAVIKSIVDNLGKATAALSREDYETLGRTAHTLKGTFLQCGMKSLAARAEEIYQGSKNKNEQLCYASLLEHLKNSWAGLVGNMGKNEKSH